MKRLFAILMTLALLLACTATAESQIAEDWTVSDDGSDIWASDNVVGGWDICDLNEAKGSDALREMFAKAVKDLDEVKYTPVALLATQSVAGMNYCILCHCVYSLSEVEDTGWALVYIDQTLDGTAEVTNVVDIDIAGLSDYGLLH